MSMRLYVAANGVGPMNKGSIVVAVLQRLDRLELRYKLPTLLFYVYFFGHYIMLDMLKFWSQ